MALELRLNLKMSQQLVMTPQLQQAIKLLQLSRMELVDVIREEMMENPPLEEGTDEDERADEPVADDAKPEGAEQDPILPEDDPKPANAAEDITRA